MRLKVEKTKIGAASFSIGKGETKTIEVKLNAGGLDYLQRAGGQAFRVKLSGKGVKSRTITVRPPRRKH